MHAILQDRAGRLWVGGSKLLMIHGDECKEYALQGYRSAARVKSILETRDGTLWVGAVSGLQWLRPGFGDRFESVAGVTNTVRVLREDTAGTVWIGSIGGGLIQFRNDRFTRVKTPDDPPSSTVLAMLEDNEQNIWIGMQTGLLRLSRTPLSTFPLPDVANADFGTVYSDHDGSLWVAGTHLYRISPGRDRPKLIPAPGQGVRVRNVFRDSSGNLWIGTDGHGVFLTMHGRQIHYTARNGLTNDFVRTFLESRDGSIWIGSDEGIARWHNGVLTDYRMEDGLCYFSVRTLLEDSRGDLWIGTDRGVSHWRQGSFIHDEITEKLAREKVWTIHEDRDGGLWFGTRGSGLFRWRDGKLTSFTTAQGLASNSIFKILEDAQGTFWMSSPEGISSVMRRDLDQLAEHPDFRPAVTLYGLSDGVEATQIHGGTEPAGCLTASGEVWFPTNRGPVRIVPGQTHASMLPQPIIEQVLLDGRERPTSGVLVVPPGKQPRTDRLQRGVAPLARANSFPLQA